MNGESYAQVTAETISSGGNPCKSTDHEYHIGGRAVRAKATLFHSQDLHTLVQFSPRRQTTIFSDDIFPVYFSAIILPEDTAVGTRWASTKVTTVTSLSTHVSKKRKIWAEYRPKLHISYTFKSFKKLTYYKICQLHQAGLYEWILLAVYSICSIKVTIKHVELGTDWSTG